MQRTARSAKNYDRLPVDDDWSFRDIDRAATSALTHSYHRYPAKFIPQIVDKLIQEYTSAGDLAVDPFGGCGTTLVEAKLGGRRSIGLDINPIAGLIAKVKVTPIEPERIKIARSSFLDAYESCKKSNIKYFERLTYWFDETSFRKLDRIYCAIKTLPSGNMRNFYLCAFSHCLKNSSRWLMKSIKPTIDRKKNIIDPFATFMRHLSSMEKKNEEFYVTLCRKGNLKTFTRIYHRDSTKTWPVANGTVDLIVTSPPYVTSYEYADLHQLSLLWFGSDREQFGRLHESLNKEFGSFRKHFIGTSSKPKMLGDFSSVLATETVNKLKRVDSPLSEDVANYFIDMKKVFSHMYISLRPGGVAGVIIGNTKLRDIDIRNAEVAVEQMEAAGFNTVKVIKRELSNRMIAPWRDTRTGKFTSISNPNRRRAYEYEYILIMRRPD